MWTPPEFPEPSEILQSARADTRDRRYEQALAKFLWYHENALKHEPYLSAVRLSFALGYWQDLARRYPPAQAALLKARDDAESEFLNNPSRVEAFHDVEALNERLGDEARTADLFERLANRDPEAAKRAYHYAESSLVKLGRFAACNEFLDAPRRVELARKSYEVQREHEETRPDLGIPIPKHARTFYVDEVATLVALLVQNGRIDEAQSAFDAATKVLDDLPFRVVMEKAMRGELPSDAAW
jgi:hypothetical protein